METITRTEVLGIVKFAMLRTDILLTEQGIQEFTTWMCEFIQENHMNRVNERDFYEFIKTKTSQKFGRDFFGKHFNRKLDRTLKPVCFEAFHLFVQFQEA